jgi:hypothetical protein
MTRRLLLALSLVCLPAAGLPRADAEKDAADLIRSAVDGLSAGSVEKFLSYFDRAMPGYDKLRFNVTGLNAQADISCNIEVRGNTGDDDARELTLDWILTLERSDGTPGAIQRHQTVKVQMKKTGKTWKIVALDPVELFAPITG